MEKFSTLTKINIIKKNYFFILFMIFLISSINILFHLIFIPDFIPFFYYYFLKTNWWLQILFHDLICTFFMELFWSHDSGHKFWKLSQFNLDFLLNYILQLISFLNLILWVGAFILFLKKKNILFFNVWFTSN